MMWGSFWGPKSMQNELRKGIGNKIGNKRAQDRQKTAPSRPKASKLGPIWPQEGSLNRSKIIQNSILGTQGDPKATQELPKNLPRPQIDPNAIPNRPQNPRTTLPFKEVGGRGGIL